MGALDTMVLFGSIDLGATTKGGCKLVYTATFYEFDIDQSLTAPDVAKTKEEAYMDVTGLAQYQMKLVAASFAISITKVTTGGAPSVDSLYVGGDQHSEIGTFDFSGLRRIGDGTRVYGQLFAVYSAKPITVNYAKENPTELQGVQFKCLADMTRPVGQRLFVLSTPT